MIANRFRLIGSSFGHIFAGFAALIFVQLGFAAMSSVHAQRVLIVAFGASNTWGKGVSRDQAYPAHFERMLRAKGIRARVVNAGINGNTTYHMLDRLGSAVPRGTRVVIFQPGGNDRRRGVSRSERKANIRAIRRRLQARGIRVVMLQRDIKGSIRARYPTTHGMHFTGAGYRAMAAMLLPRVLRALGR